MQLLHCRLLLAVAFTKTNMPAAHVATGVHAYALEVFENPVLSVQLPHCLSSVVVALRVMN